MGTHANLAGANIHVIHRWTVADQTERLALSVDIDDVGKVALQISPLKFFVLSDYDPMTWVEIGGGGVSDGDKGDITVSSSGSVWTIDNNTVAYGKIQAAVNGSRVLANTSAGGGNFSEATVSQILDFVGSAANGDMLRRNAGTWGRLAIGSQDQVLRSTGSLQQYSYLNHLSGVGDVWTFAEDDTTPGSGQIGAETGIGFDELTECYINTTSANSVGFSDLLDYVDANTHQLLIRLEYSRDWALFDITAISLDTGVYQLTLDWVAHSGDYFSDGERYYIQFIKVGGGGGGVNNPMTTNLDAAGYAITNCPNYDFDNTHTNYIDRDGFNGLRYTSESMHSFGQPILAGGGIITNGLSIQSSPDGAGSAANISLRSANTNGALTSGDVEISSGSTTDGDTHPGDINLTSGTCTSIVSGSNYSGDINFRTGNTGDAGRGIINFNDMWKVTEYYPTSNTTRLISLLDGAELSGKNQDVSDSVGGSLEIRGGAASGNANGGELLLRGGYGSGTGVAGGIRMNAGDEAFIVLENLPTSDPAIAGALWNDSGTLKISAGA